MKYGYFDDAHREYIITNPRTPVKWINYIGSLNFGGYVDHTGGALICKGDPALNRITKYITQTPASDFRGETLYLRIRNFPGFKLYSPYYVPTLDAYDLFECHVGLGYTRLVSEFYGIRTDTTIFVPVDAECELRSTLITNVSDQPIEIDAIPVVEYTHFDALKQLTNADWVPQTMQSQAYPEPSGHLVLSQYAFMRKGVSENFFTSNIPVSSYETDRRIFLGDNEYGSWSNPLSLTKEELPCTQARRGDNIAALLHHLGRLEPGESRQLITQLWQTDQIETVVPQFFHFRSSEAARSALANLASRWESYLGKFQARTPDESMDHMLNVHNPRQCYITLNWSRYLSLYQLGYGSRGIGFRDSSQDVMGILGNASEEGKALICKLLQTQKRDGSALHQFNPLTMVASAGDIEEVDGAPHYYSDDHLWIVLAVTSYLKETGDFAFLEKILPFYEKNKDGSPIESGNIFEHLQRAIEFTHGDTGSHGFPRLGFADWNDTVNLREGAESLFTANLYGKALLEMISLCHHIDHQDLANNYLAYYKEMRDRVNQHAWDGEWYVRYYDWDGTPLGSNQNTQGKIYINSQSWAVISGFAPFDRARLAMDSVYTMLNTRLGIKLSTPGFNGFDPHKGGVTTYPPGAKENGGIFLHTNPWAIIAESILGNGQRAFEYYSQINPSTKNDYIDEFECEPYVYPQNILGNEHPQFGMARNSWLTGTASWMYLAGTMYILGIRPTYRGLQIEPCIPPQWIGFSVRRYFRGSGYEIEVDNSNHVSKGVVRISVDGIPHEGNILPVYEDGAVHHVKVMMG